MTRPEPAGVGTAELTVARFREAARELKQALAENAYPAADGTADIDNNAIDIIAVTIAHFVAAAESRAMERCAKICEVAAGGENALYAGTRGRGGQARETEFAAARDAFQAAAATIRSSISPQGTEE